MMLGHALTLLEQGRSIIPLHSPEMSLDSLPPHIRRRIDPQGAEWNPRDIGKIPLISWDIYKLKHPEEKEVRLWWKDWPEANIGIPCGAVSGLFVVDADGEMATAYLIEHGISLITTLSVQTGRGYHFYFKYPGFEVHNEIAMEHFADGSQIDIKGDRGYVVTVPSLHASGIRYDWMDPDIDLRPAPEWLLDRIRTATKAKSKLLPADELRRLLQGVSDGERHNAGMKLIAHWFGTGMSPRHVQESLVAWNQACKPPGDEANLLRIVDHIWSTEKDKRRNPEEPKFERQGDDFIFTWPDIGIRAELTNLHREHGGIQGTIDITSNVTGDLHWGRLILQSSTAREELVHPTRGKLVRIRNDINWGPMLEHICKQAADAWLRGEATMGLLPTKVPLAVEIQTPIIPMPKDETTVLFADGGSGKSLLALFICLMSNEPCLYLDWESNIEEHQDRLRALLNGFGRTDIPTHIYYRRMSRPIDEEAQFIRKEIARLKIRHLVVDSYGPAAVRTGDWTDSAVRTMDTIRSLGSGVTRLLLTHVSKDSSGQTEGAGKPIASVYIPNLARSSWEMRQGDNEGDSDFVSVRLDHRKVNRGRRCKPRGFHIGFVENNEGVLESIVILPIDYRTIVLNGHQPLVARVELFLEMKNSDAEIKEIADALGEDEGTILKTAKRHSRKFIFTKKGGQGAGDRARIGLRARGHEEGGQGVHLRPPSAPSAPNKVDTL